MFDLTVHKRDSKGKISSVNPYRLEIVNGVRRFERPPHSGIWYNEGGEMEASSRIKLEELEQAEAKKEADKQAQAKKAHADLEELKRKAAAYDASQQSQKR